MPPDILSKYVSGIWPHKPAEEARGEGVDYVDPVANLVDHVLNGYSGTLLGACCVLSIVLCSSKQPMIATQEVLSYPHKVIQQVLHDLSNYPAGMTLDIWHWVFVGAAVNFVIMLKGKYLERYALHVVQDAWVCDLKLIELGNLLIAQERVHERWVVAEQVVPVPKRAVVCYVFPTEELVSLDPARELTEKEEKEIADFQNLDFVDKWGRRVLRATDELPLQHYPAMLCLCHSSQLHHVHAKGGVSAH